MYTSIYRTIRAMESEIDDYSRIIDELIRLITLSVRNQGKSDGNEGERNGNACVRMKERERERVNA